MSEMHNSAGYHISEVKNVNLIDLIKESTESLSIYPYRDEHVAEFRVEPENELGVIVLGVYWASQEQEGYYDENPLRGYICERIKREAPEFIGSIDNQNQLTTKPFSPLKLSCIWDVITSAIDDFHDTRFDACCDCGGFKGAAEYYCCEIQRADCLGVEEDEL